jgi:hypothetical protein
MMRRSKSFRHRGISPGNSMYLQHVGGVVFFLICVKLVKRSLKKVTGNAKLSYEELETTLIEIEGRKKLNPKF